MESNERTGFKKYWDRITSYLKLTEEALYAQRLFWWAIGFPLLLSFIFALPLMFQGLRFEFSSDGYAFFAKEFAFPLWISSGAIIFGVTVGRFHGSLQRHKAIEQTELNNNFKNYFEHRKMFFEQFGANIVKCRLQYLHDSKSFEYSQKYELDIEHLYKIYFKENKQTKFSTQFFSLATTAQYNEILRDLEKRSSIEDFDISLRGTTHSLYDFTRVRLIEQDELTDQGTVMYFIEFYCLVRFLLCVEQKAVEISSSSSSQMTTLQEKIVTLKKKYNFSVRSIEYDFEKS